jgi:RNA polymerase sigma-70 factor (ECF subfamily)
LVCVVLQNPRDVEFRRDPEDMGVSLALPSALPQGSRRETTGATPPDHEELTDGDLIRLVARRDANAFETLYRRFARPVFGLALRRLGDRMRAEDAVQETFAAVWRSARTYKPDRGAGAPWLYAVARNAIVDRSRSKSDPPAEVPDTPSNEPGPEERAEASDVSWRVHRALESLTQNERDVIELAYYGGLSQSEVADFLGIPLGTVKTRTRAGLGRLADLLEGELQ